MGWTRPVLGFSLSQAEQQDVIFNVNFTQNMINQCKDEGGGRPITNQNGEAMPGDSPDPIVYHLKGGKGFGKPGGDLV